MLELSNLFLSDGHMEKSNNTACYFSVFQRPSFSVAVGEHECENVQTTCSLGISQCSCNAQCLKALGENMKRKAFLISYSSLKDTADSTCPLMP